MLVCVKRMETRWRHDAGVCKPRLTWMKLEECSHSSRSTLKSVKNTPAPLKHFLMTLSLFLMLLIHSTCSHSEERVCTRVCLPFTPQTTPSH